MMNYRFVIASDGEILAFDKGFQKEVYQRYLKANGLTETNVFDANTDWDELDDECPSPLPKKYSGDVYENLNRIYRELYSIGVWTELDVIFENIVGRSQIDEEDSMLTMKVIDKLGWKFQKTVIDGRLLYFVE
jgi:hypothetical protein